MLRRLSLAAALIVATVVHALAVQAAPDAGRLIRDAAAERLADARVDADASGRALRDATALTDARSDARDAQLDAGGAASDAAVDAGDAAESAVSDAGADAAAETDAGQVLPAPLEPRPQAPTPEEGGKSLLWTLLGLLALFVLAYVAAHPRVKALEERLGIATAITSGFPFVALGLIARHPAVGILDHQVLDHLLPALHFGLGWLGFLLGFQFEARQLDRTPVGTGAVVALQTLVPAGLIALACGGLLLLLGQPWQGASFARDGIVLGAAGAMTSTAGVRLVARIRNRAGAKPLDVTRHLDEIVCVIGLAFLGAYFRPQGGQSAWELPGTAWLFLTIGMGAAMGALVYFVLRRASTRAEFIAIALGSVAFAGGLASYLMLSPIVVCFFAGVVVASLESNEREAFQRTLADLERPIYFVFMIVAGALWNPSDWRGWVLCVLFLVARYCGLAIGTRAARARHPEIRVAAGRYSVLVSPLSPLAIAVVLNAQNLYPGGATSWLVTSVIGAALVSEVIAQVAARVVNLPPESIRPPMDSRDDTQPQQHTLVIPPEGEAR